VPGSRESFAWLRGLQQHLGDWHDLEVMERTLTEMVAQPRFVRERLEIASGTLQLIRRNRSVKKRFEEKYLQVTRHSAQYEYTKAWITHLISSPAAVFPAPPRA
jgi:CHAD domain-containing protein